MKIPEFYKGDRTKNHGRRQSFHVNREMADKAEATWRKLGHDNVLFYVTSIDPGGIYAIRSNLVNGLPPKGAQ